MDIIFIAFICCIFLKLFAKPYGYGLFAFLIEKSTFLIKKDGVQCPLTKDCKELFSLHKNNVSNYCFCGIKFYRFIYQLL